MRRHCPVGVALAAICYDLIGIESSKCPSLSGPKKGDERPDASRRGARSKRALIHAATHIVCADRDKQLPVRHWRIGEHGGGRQGDWI